MDGGICFNEWLIREGYLTLAEPVDQAHAHRQGEDRLGEDQGLGRRRLLRPLLHERPRPRAVRDDRSRPTTRRSGTSWSPKIEAITDPQGRNIGSKVYKPEDIYRQVNGVAPDLIVYFGDLAWRSVGAVGMGGIYTFENDTGPDEANHDWYGMFILTTNGAPAPLTRRAAGRDDLRRRADAAEAPRPADPRRPRPGSPIL